MNRLAIVLVASLLVATYSSEASLDGIREKYNRLRGRHSGHHGASGYGASASSAAAATNGLSGSAAAASTASGSNYGGYSRPHATHHQPHHQPHYQYAPEAGYAPYVAAQPVSRYNSGGAAAASSAAAASTGGVAGAPAYHHAPASRYNYDHQPAYVAPVAHHVGRYGSHTGGAAASSAAAAASSASNGAGYVAQPAHLHRPHYPAAHAPVVAPVVSAPRYSAPVHQHYVAPAVSGGSSAAAASAAAAGAASAGAAASNAAASHSVHGHDAHVAAPVNNVVSELETYNEHYDEPESVNTHSEAHGTYANNGNGHESSSYVRSTEDVQNHEDGRQDDNHYYNAQSYGKTYDENNHEAFNDLVDDVIHTPNVFKSSKRSTNYVKDQNKARRESGSGVLAHDKHSSSYNKNSRKFNEQVDQRNHKAGAGIVDTSSFSENHNIDDEDLESYDSDGLGNFVGVDGHHHAARPHVGPRAATATSAVTNGAVSTSAAVGQNAASSSSAASGSH